MSDTNKRLTMGTFTNASATLYTVPASTTTYVKAITICNKTSTSQTVTILFAGTEILYQYPMDANDTITIPFIDQILQASETITGLAGNNTSVTYYISGREVS